MSLKVNEDNCIDEISINYILDKISSVASSIAKSPIAVISLMEGKRYNIRSTPGILDANTASNFTSWIKRTQFVSPFVVPSSDLDLIFNNDPSGISPNAIKFCVGAPIVTSEAEVLGTICILDYVHKRITEDKLKLIKDLADIVAVVLESNRKLRHLAMPKSSLATLMPVCYQCKNVRHEDGEWQPFERFIETELGLKVSHGVCEKCSDSLG